MATTNNVKFLRGTSTGFAAITTKDENTFYYLTDTKKLYLGSNPISEAADLEEILNSIGDLTTLKTTDKESLVKAINEVFDKIAASTTESKITLEKDADNYVYKIRQGTASTENPDSNLIGTINFPADLIVKSASVVTNPAGQTAGKYIEMVIAGQDSDSTLYIDLSDLIDPYSGAPSAAQVQISISDSNVISATIVAGSVTATELATDAVETAKIKDKAVTKAKLAQEVQDAIDALAWGTF